MKDVINNLKISDTFKIQLTITINFISSTDNDNDDDDREHVMQSDNKEIMINDKADQFLEVPFGSLINRYQTNLQESMKNSKFAFNYVHLLHYKCHKINANCGGSYIDSSDWIKSKKSNSKSHK